RRGGPRPAAPGPPEPGPADPDGGVRGAGARGPGGDRLRRQPQRGDVRATVVLPVKRFNAAKQRMESGLGGEQRRLLAEAMLGDVLEELGGARMVDGGDVD